MSQQQRQRHLNTSAAHQSDAAPTEIDVSIGADEAVVELNNPITDPNLKRCWICFEEENDATVLASQWRWPCKCSLVAHEECLLAWVDETQKGTTQGVNSARSIKCPQCKEAYVIKSSNSLGVSLMSFADDWITRGLLATIPLGLIKAVGITCFYYGQGAMLDVLGEDRLADLILSLKPGDEVRYVIGASCIPFALVGSRFDLFNFVMPLLPSLVCFSDTSFIQSRRPMDASPALWVCALPWIRNLYCFFWRLFLGRTEKRWQKEAGLVTANIREIAPGIGIREVVNEGQAEQQHAQGQVNDGDPDEIADQEDDAVAERWIFVEAPKLARLVAGALLLPKIALMAGNFLDRMPLFRKRYPHRFQKVILGGLSFVLCKDMLSLVFLYNRAKGRSTRHIINRRRVNRGVA